MGRAVRRREQIGEKVSSDPPHRARIRGASQHEMEVMHVASDTQYHEKSWYCMLRISTTNGCGTKGSSNNRGSRRGVVCAPLALCE
jgi:hypothetical protein